MRLISFNHSLYYFLAIFSFYTLSTSDSFAQGLLGDNNGDGKVVIAAFGDSITRGIGDGIDPDEIVDDASVRTEIGSEAGYPLRLEERAGVNITNRGTPGAKITDSILQNFTRYVSRERPDLVIISGGSNDSFQQTLGTVVTYSYQAMINVAKALEVEILIVTTPPTCCNRGANNIYLNDYNQRLRELADLNQVRIADVNQAFLDSCPDIMEELILGNFSSCPLLIRNEGLHPNTLGYDLMADVIQGSL